MTKKQNRLRNLMNSASKIIKKKFSPKAVLTVLMAIIVVQIISPGTVFAEDNTTLKGMAEIAGVVINIVTFMALLMMNFFGKLLGTDFLTGPAAMQAITPMWVWVRNLTNILFVMVLVGLAFSNLYSSFSKEGGGNWTIKDKLPKVIIALVAINFSLLGFKVVIDAINVGTVAILGIADSRLDADNSDLEGAMLKSKTWMIVSEAVYKKFNDAKKIEELTATDKIRGGDSCTKVHNDTFNGDHNKDTTILGFKKGKWYFVCRDFRSSVNDLFCGKWEDIAKNSNNGKEKEDIDQSLLDDDCLFILKENKFKTMIDPKDEPGQNLFMSFGTIFVHLERLPALGAEINSLNGVIMNTLFSSIIALAYLVALIAIFIALIARMVVIWIALVFSPLLIAASIMGFDQGEGGKISEQLVTHLIMPLKIAAAFAVSFVMMSAMIDFNIVGKNEAFVFGPALSHLGIGEFGFLWQMATIVIFWMAAKWAVEGSLAKDITGKIFTGAEELGSIAARAATVDRQIFSVGTGGKDKKFSMSNILSMPSALQTAQNTKRGEGLIAMKDALGITQSDFAKSIQTKTFDDSKGFYNNLRTAKSKQEVLANESAIMRALERAKQEGKIFAAPLLAKIESDGFLKGIDNFGASNSKAGYTRGTIYNDDFYGGSGSGDSAKKDAAKAAADNVNIGANGGLTVAGDGISNEDIAKGIINNNKAAEAILKKGSYGEAEILRIAEISEATVTEVASKLIEIGATVHGMKSSTDAPITVEKGGDNNNNFLAYKETSKDNSKAQAVYLAHKENSVAYDMSAFGGGKNGKVDASNMTAVMAALEKVSNTGETKGITKGIASAMTAYIKSQKFVELSGSNKEKTNP